ncbi:MAG: glycosyltransferase family 4 protein [Acidobacteria bacterium]|nr:glycosyltransferase family 4 protein [Acidobacteriota bacterium]
MSHRIGYVVKRFPRVSETFIAQEILELERQGAEVRIFTLWPNDAPARHAWLRDIVAPVDDGGDTSLAGAWKWLHHRASADTESQARCELALTEAFRYSDRRGRHRLREAVVVADAALRHSLQHLHAHFANDPAFVAYLAHLMSGLPFSFTAHAKDIYAKALPAATLRRVVAAAAFGVTVSDDNRESLEGMLGQGLAPKILRLYNGVDLESIRPTKGRTVDRPFGIVCVARLVEKKGVDALVQALAVLEQREIDFRCTIVGDGPLRTDLESLVRRQELHRHVRFRGNLAHEAVVAEFASHDVLVLPARVAEDGDRDALPTVLLEAMAAGLPTISTAVGGIPEIIDHRRTGLVLPNARPLVLADALAELEAHPRLRSLMARAARERAEELFDRRSNVRRLHDWFSQSCRGETVIDSPRILRAVEG